MTTVFAHRSIYRKAAAFLVILAVVASVGMSLRSHWHQLLDATLSMAVGPMALAFHLGQQISENIHPPVTVWNFSRGYEWGIDLAAAVTGDPCVMHPTIATPTDAREEK